MNGRTNRTTSRTSPAGAYQARRTVLAAVLLLTVLFAPCLAPLQALAEDPLQELKTFSTLLVDVRRSQVLFSSNPDEQVHAPILSKMMTVLVALEQTKPDAMATVSSEAASVDGAVMNLRVGEKYAIESLMFAALLHDANDAAQTLAEFVGGDEEAFVAMMNERAVKLGMAGTHFSNPTGIADNDQYTTASDIALFMRDALSNTSFARIFGTQAKPWYDNQKTVLMTNADSLFWSYDGTDGGMYAASGEETCSMLTTVTRSSMRLLLIQLEAPKHVAAREAADVLDYGFSNYRYGTLVSAGQILRTVTIEGQSINLVPASDVAYVYPVGRNDVKDLSIAIHENKLKPPILKSDVLGTASYTLGDGTVIQVDLYPDREWLPEKTRLQVLKERLETNKELVWLILALVLIELAMIGTKIVARLIAWRKREIARTGGDGK